MTDKHFEALVIGAGPGGYELVAALARRGLQTAIIEEYEPGGTCLNRGCVPTKALCASGDASWSESKAHATEVIAQLRSDIRSLLRDVEWIQGRARMLPGREVAVGDDIFSADRIFIATGSRPAALPVEGWEFTVDSTQFLELDGLPKSAVIIGAGVIGLEFAGIMARKGVDVTLVEYCPEILPPADRDVSKRLQSMLKRQGIVSICGARVTKILPGGTVCYEGKRGQAEVSGEMVLGAVGRRAVVPEGCTEAGIELTERGFIKVNPATMATTAEGIYAIGDCNGLCLLAHAASAQGRLAIGEKVDMSAMPSVVFTHPPCSWVGATEQQLKDRGTEYVVGKAMYAGNAKAMADGTTEGFVKVLAEKNTRRILGVHMLGVAADSMIGEATMAVALGLTADTVASEIIHPHPTLTELFPSACYDCK